jgi:SAM-dependent methyltransferase
MTAAARLPFQGVRQIVRYNWGSYAAGAAAIAAAALVSFIWPAWRTVMLMATLPALWWLGASLLVSYYAYDLSPFYKLAWLQKVLSQTPLRWVNIHAGLDETSLPLTAKFPLAQRRILDIYDAREMTEPSIAEARRTRIAPLPAIATDWRALSAPDEWADAVFLIFAAHELRNGASRSQFFQEISRVLRRGGELILVEHLRNWSNFLAFGPGFFHFLPERAWRQAAAASRLEIIRRSSLTPFIHVFVLRRPE